MLVEVLKDESAKQTLAQQISGILGKKIWFQAKNRRPFLVEIVPIPELVNITISSEKEIKNGEFPGVIFDPVILQEALAGKLNPLTALVSGKIKVSGLMELTKMGSFLASLAPFREKDGLRQNVSIELLQRLDSALKTVGC